MTHWTARSADHVWRSWDDEEIVVFHVPSGATHLLNRVSAMVLRHLEDRSLTVAELTSRLAQSLDCDADDELRVYVEQLLGGFDRLGLAEPT